jgi:uncharacterized phage-associated protein
MPAPYPARYAVNSLLERSFKEGRPDMSPMKAQKMLFFTHGWHLATTGLPAIDKPFEVWQYGPVVGQVYHDLKAFGSGSINSYLKDEGSDKAFVVAPMHKAFYDALDIAWEKYIGYSAVTLSTLTHCPQTPWANAKAAGLTEIPDEMIRDYFVRQSRQH